MVYEMVARNKTKLDTILTKTCKKIISKEVNFIEALALPDWNQKVNVAIA